MTKKEKVVVFDANSVIHRAFHALPPLTSPKGEIINAVYGFTSILLKVLRELKPDYVLCAFDYPAKTFRHELYKEYKAHRQETPEDLTPQFKKVEQILESLSIPGIQKEGFEADDIIGTISQNLSAKDKEIIIVTGDLDELQLIGKNTKVYTMRKGFTDTVVYNETAVKEKYGFESEKLPDYKGLRGDPSDNIPGVPGIGEKTALYLIQKFNNLENIYQNLNRIEPKIRKNLEPYKNQAFLSRDLAKIKKDIKIDLNLSLARIHEFDYQKAFSVFKDFGFKSLLNKLSEITKHPKGIEKEFKEIKNGKNYQAVISKEEFLNLLKNLEKQKIIAVDTETDSVDPIKANLIGICLSYKENKGYYVPVGHRNNSNLNPPPPEADGGQMTNKVQNPNDESTQLDLNFVLEKLKPIFENPKIQKVGHNIKFDWQVLKKYGINMFPLSFDTMIAAYLLNPNLRAQKLEDLAFAELGIKMQPIFELISKGKEEISFDRVSIQKAAQYAAEDADIALRIYYFLLPQLEKEDLIDLFLKIEMPLVPVLAKMEMAGVKINDKFLEKMSLSFEKKIKTLEQKIWQKSGQHFNINSPLQLKKVLFEKLNLASNIEIKKHLKKVKTGGYSTAAGELEKLRHLHPVIELISQYRELVKLKTTYIDALPKLVNPETDRVHTSFNQAITATGRLSSSNPNLQNIPLRTDIGNEIRKAFVAEKSNKLLSCDYSQIELRIMAHLSGDKNLMTAFFEKVDIHTKTAAQIFGVPISKVNPRLRRIAKAVNFGIIYGISPYGLSEGTGLSREKAKDFIEKYFQLHPKVKNYIEKVKKTTKELGYVGTLFGRKRHLPEINSPNAIVQNAAERMAINTPVQGTAADLIKLAMIEIDNQLSRISSNTKMILQVHDELVFEVPKNDIQKVAQFVKEKMENIVSLKVPIEAEIKVGDNWGEMKKI